MVNIQKKLEQLIKKSNNAELIKAWNDFVNELHEYHGEIMKSQFEASKELEELNKLVKKHFQK